MQRIIACQECKRQWDVTRYEAGQKLRCACSHVMEVPEPRAHTPDVHHCEACGAARSAPTGACEYCGATPTEDAAKLSVVCPFCFHRTQKNSQFCSSCGETIQAGTLHSKAGKLKCPRCSSKKLFNRKVGAFFVDECTVCAGMWIPIESFDRLVKQQSEGSELSLEGSRTKGPKKAVLDQNVSYIKCPECDRLMNRFNFARVSGVIVDECREHGVWLDADEMGKIAAFVASGGLRALERYEEENDTPRAHVSIPAMSEFPNFKPEFRETNSGLSTILEVVRSLF